MKYLHVYAYPAQMIALQLQENNKIIQNTNCFFEDTLNEISNYLNDNPDIDIITIIGQTKYADKLEELINIHLEKSVTIERINYND